MSLCLCLSHSCEHTRACACAYSCVVHVTSLQLQWPSVLIVKILDNFTQRWNSSSYHPIGFKVIHQFFHRYFEQLESYFAMSPFHFHCQATILLARVRMLELIWINFGNNFKIVIIIQIVFHLAARFSTLAANTPQFLRSICPLILQC